MTHTKTTWEFLKLLGTVVVAGVAIAFGLLTVPKWTAQAEDPFLRRTATVRAAERVGPAVVNITTERVVQVTNPFSAVFNNPRLDRFFEDFAGPQRQQRTQTVQSLGSGVIFDKQGHVLTNAHVVAKADRVKVTLADGREFETRQMGTDPSNDLAVLKIETTEHLPWVAPGISSDLMVGEPVIAIGNPFGFENTVTTGVISATDRSVRESPQSFIHGLLQTDASINPGNSGGPLLNAEGKLVGINTAIYSNAQGIGFAIPIDTARRVIAELLEHGEVVPVWLGLQFQNLDPSLREVMQLPAGMSGALVSGIRDGGPADKAGIQRGDIITTFETRPLKEARRFFEMLNTATPDQSLRLEIWRNSEIVKVTVVARKFPDKYINELAESILRMRLRESPRPGFLIENVRPDSAAAKIGIRRGDILVKLGGRALNSRDDLRRSVLALRGQPRTHLVIDRGGRRHPVNLFLVQPASNS